MRYESILDTIGNTPLVRMHSVDPNGARLYAKLELTNPFGMKDRFACHALLSARASGQLKQGDIVVESSSGTLAVGLAMVGAALGHEVHIITDPRIDPVTLAKLKSLKAVVYIVEQMNERGWQGARLEKLEQVRAEHPTAFWPQQYTNALNPQAYAKLAQELIEDLGHVDIIVGSVGSGGSLSGTAHVLKAANPDLLVVAVDAVGSAIFNQPDRPGRLQSGLGNSLVPANVDHSIIEQVHWLNDAEAFSATLRLAQEEQIFAGNSSGSTYWTARWYCKQSPADCNIVVILPDRGDRYFQTIHNSQFCEQRQLALECLPDNPIQVAYGTPVQSWSYAHLR